ncbi:MAG: hypothetical protein JXQ29_01010 [Planctomycetes bacterium]|nr:hypothetical protein [Planctomycetota bacterium]
MGPTEFYTRGGRRSQGRVAALLALGAAILAAAAAVWWQLRTVQPAQPRPSLAAYRLAVDPNRTDRLAVQLELHLSAEDVARSPPAPLAGPPRWFDLEVRRPDGRRLDVDPQRAGVPLDMREAGTYRITYAVPLGDRNGPVHTSIGTRFGGAVALRDALLLPPAPVPLRLEAELPVGWQLHGPPGLRADGALERAALATGAVAWTHSACHSLISPPHALDVFFLGRTGLGDPLLEPLGLLARELVKDVAVRRPLRHRILLVDLAAPHLRLEVAPQGQWQILEHGPVTVHRMVRILRGILPERLPAQSASDPGPDAVWYPRALVPYGAYLLAETCGVRSPLDWFDLWRIQEHDYLWERNQRNSPRAAALKGAVVLHELSRTHPNATSLQLLSAVARNRTLLDSFLTAMAMQLNLADPERLARARGAEVYRDAESLWQLPVLYEEPRAPAGAVGMPDLRLLVTAETYAEVMGCTGCPAPGTMAQRVFRARQRAGEGAPTLLADAGDWTPFFLEALPAPAVFEERVALARFAAARAGAAALVLGPGEVGWGAAALGRLLGADAVPVVGANVRPAGGPVPRAWVLHPVGDLVVALVGLADIPRRRYRLAWFEEALAEIALEAPVEAAVRAAKEARQAGADLVVVLGAIDPVHARLMTARDSEIDLVVSAAPGFDRPPAPGATSFTAHDRSGFHGGVPVLYTSGFRGSLHRFDLKLDRRAERVRVIDFVSAVEPLTRDAPGDTEVEVREAAFQSRHGAPGGGRQ